MALDNDRLRFNMQCRQVYIYIYIYIYITKLNSVAWVHKRTILTKRQPLVGEVSANFWGLRVPCGQRDWSLWLYSRFSRPVFLYVCVCVCVCVRWSVLQLVKKSSPNILQVQWCCLNYTKLSVHKMFVFTKMGIYISIPIYILYIWNSFKTVSTTVLNRVSLWLSNYIIRYE
jgi:hypothetical protein